MDEISSIGAPKNALPDDITVPTAKMKLTLLNKSSLTSIQTTSSIVPLGPICLFDHANGTTSDTDHRPSSSLRMHNDANGSIQTPRVNDKIGPTPHPGSFKISNDFIETQTQQYPNQQTTPSNAKPSIVFSD